VNARIDDVVGSSNGDLQVIAPPPQPEEDDHDFFDKLADTPREASPRGGAQAAPVAAPHAGRDGTSPAVSPRGDAGATEFSADADDVAIQRALVMGNYQAAVAACLAAQRLGDALVLAAVGGTDLWLSTQAEYLRRTPRPYLRVVSSVVKNDLAQLVATRPLSQWRETLALLCTYAPSGEWGPLTGALARRLASSGMHHPAVLCHICAGDMDSAVQHWSSSTTPGSSSASKGSSRAAPVALGHLRRVVEKGVVLMHACAPSPQQQQACGALSGVVNTYAELLAAQGKLEAALQYLSMVPADHSPESAVLRDRIMQSRVAAATRHAAPMQTHVQQQQQQYSAPSAAYAPAPPQANRPSPTSPYMAAPVQQQPVPPAPSAAYHYAPMPQAPPPPAAASYAPSPTQPVNFAAQQQQPAAQQYTPPQHPGSVQQSAAAYAPMPPRHAYAPAPPVTPPPPAAAQPQMQYMPQAPPQPPPQASAFAPAPTSSMASQQPHGAFVPAAPPGGPPAVPVAQAQQTQGMQPPRYGTPAAAPPRGGAYPGAPPQQAAPEVAAAPPPPPPANVPPANTTLETVATNEVAPDARGVVTTLMGLYSACIAAAGGNPAKKRELDDSSKRLGALLWRLNKRDVSQSVLSKLQALCGALDRGDYATVNALIVQLTSADWEECSQWVPALKRLVKAGGAGR